MNKVSRDHKYISLRKSLLEQVKSKVHLIDGGDDSELKSYFLPYKKELHEKKWFPVQRSEFIDEIINSDVIIGGDFHAFAQSQRTHLRIIRSLKKLKKPLVVALECFESKDQHHVDDYLAGKINEEELRSSTSWDESWHFPFKNYLPLLRYAKNKNYKIIAINYKSELDGEDSHFRDNHIAKQICNYRQSNSDALIYVVIGDLHISPAHLPKSLLSIDENLKLYSVFQNSEKLYFDLLEQKLENKVDIMRTKDRQFCILTSPPWVKWQSYLMYLESSNDFDMHEFDMCFDDEEYDDDEFEDEDFIESIDYTDQLFSVFSFLNNDLGLELNFDQAEVFTDLSEFLLDRLENELESKEFQLVQQLVKNSKSFYLPQMGVIYLSRHTTNHASEVIGKYIQAQLSGRKDNLFDLPNQFKPLIWIETLSYFLSKIYNHKRKTMGFKALKAELLTINPKDSNHEILKHSLGHTMNEYFTAFNLERSKLKLDPLIDSYSYAESARILGQFKGEQLYQNFHSGLFDKKSIKQLIKTDVLSEEFSQFYESIAKVLLSKNKSSDKKEYIL